MAEKDVRITEKRVDDAWKESVRQAEAGGEKSGRFPEEKAEKPGEVSFSSLITSLGLQGLVQLGEIRTEQSPEPKVDLEAARETIDLLAILKEKTKGNLEPREEALLTHLLADLQMKFVARPKTAAPEARP